VKPTAANPRSRLRRLAHRVLAVLAGLLLALVLLELGLRIYNPFEAPLRGDKIELPVYKRAIYHPPADDLRFDHPVYHSRNSLGFRGPEPPRDFAGSLSLLCVGGSTTNCRLLTDGKTWPELMHKALEPQFPKLWVNNAGFDGHSTYGHLVLVEDILVKLKPKYILFLTGFNDIGRDDITSSDLQIERKKNEPVRAVLANFETWVLMENATRHLLAMDKGLTHKLKTNDQDAAAVLSPERLTDAPREHFKLIEAYRERLRQLADACRAGGMEPLFMTQPTAYVTAPKNAAQVSAQHVYRAVLDAYNTALLEVAKEQGVCAIDLAPELSGEAEAFYDMGHFTNQGAERVAEIAARELGKFLSAKMGH